VGGEKERSVFFLLSTPHPSALSPQKQTPLVAGEYNRRREANNCN
jgi:hypothetical protein